MAILQSIFEHLLINAGAFVLICRKIHEALDLEHVVADIPTSNHHFVRGHFKTVIEPRVKLAEDLQQKSLRLTT